MIFIGNKTPNETLTNGKWVFTVASGKTVTFSPGFMYWDGNSFEFETSQTGYSLGEYHSETGKYNWNPNHVNYFFWSKTASVAYDASYSDASASVSDVFFTNNQSDQAKPNSGFTVNGEIGIWRTLRSAEWVYLLNVSGSEGRTGNRFAKAMVNSKKGLQFFLTDTVEPLLVMALPMSTRKMRHSLGAAYQKSLGLRCSQPALSFSLLPATALMETSAVSVITATTGRVLLTPRMKATRTACSSVPAMSIRNTTTFGTKATVYVSCDRFLQDIPIF